MTFHRSRREFLQAASVLVTGAELCRAQRGAAAAQAPAGQNNITAPKSARITSGIMVWTLKGTFEEKLAHTAQAGIQSVELVNEHLTWSDAQVAAYRQALQSYGLGIDVLLAQHDWTKRPVTMVNPAHRDGFLADVKEAIGWAQRLNVPQMIVMSGNVQTDLSHEAQYAAMVEAGKRAADLAAAADLTLILEPLNSKVNHKGYFLTSTREGLQAVKQVDNPHFRLLFDIYHEYVQNGDPIPLIADAASYTNVFHVADAPGRHDPGTGEMKWDDIYKAIAKTNYSGYITLEYQPVGDEVESLMKSVTQMRKDLTSVTATGQGREPV